MPYYVQSSSRHHLQPTVNVAVPRTPPTPMYSDDEETDADSEYPRQTRYPQAWPNQRQSQNQNRRRYADDDSEDRESSEPTVSGFEPAYDQVDRGSKAIVANDKEQLLVFRSIQGIHPVALEPFGPLKPKDPRTGRYGWLRRTPEGIIASVWCRINNTASDVVFEVTLHTKEVLEVHVPLDSWHRKTCDSEAVRAAIQQAYLNLLRGHDNAVIVKPAMRCLRFITQHEYEDICYSSGSSSSSKLSRLSSLFRSGSGRQSQKVSLQVPPGHNDRRPPIRLSSPPPPRPHPQQTRPPPLAKPAAAPAPQPQTYPQHTRSRSLSQSQVPLTSPAYHHSRSQSQVLSAHPAHLANPVLRPKPKPIQVFSSPVPIQSASSPHTAPAHQQRHTAYPHPPPSQPLPHPHHHSQANYNYKNTGAGRLSASAQPPVFPSRTSGYY